VKAFLFYTNTNIGLTDIGDKIFDGLIDFRGFLNKL